MTTPPRSNRVARHDVDGDATAPGLLELAAYRRVGRHRYLLIAFVAACGGVVTGGRGDWNFFVGIGREMFGDAGAHVYSLYPEAQTGPLSLIVAAALSFTPRDGFVACVLLSGAIGVWSVRRIEVGIDPAIPAGERHVRVLLGGVVVAAWWSLLGSFGHLDDAVAIASALVAVDARRRGASLRAGIALGIGVAFKPWAVMFWPLCLPAAPGGPIGFRLRGLVALIGIQLVVWSPFLIADGTQALNAEPTVLLADDSVLRLLGLSTWALSPGVRVLQLALSSAVVWWTMRRGLVEMTIAAGIAVRIALDPGTWSYYAAGLVLGMLLWELRCRREFAPARTLAAGLMVAPAWLVPIATVRALLRLAGALAIVGTASSTRSPAGRAPERSPT